VRDDQRASLIDVFGYVEDLDKEILATALPWSWQTQGELHEALAGGLGIDVAFLVGHTPLRLYVMGTEAWERTATDREIEQMGSVLDESIAADAQGLSTSFFDTDATGRPVPSAIADDRELGRLLDVLAKWGFVLEFIPPDLRQADYRADYRADIERVAALCRPRGVRATWNGLFAWGDRPDFAPGVLDHASLLQGEGAQIYPQVSPRPLDTRINWDGGMTPMRLKEGWWWERSATWPSSPWRSSCMPTTSGQ
jgi:hypothetical protein